MRRVRLLRGAGALARFVREHEVSVLRDLDAGSDLAAAALRHERKLGYLQTERLAHLHVTLAFGAFLLLAFIAYLLRPTPLFALLGLLLLMLLLPYLVHYFMLENSVQRWYALSDELRRRDSNSL